MSTSTFIIPIEGLTVTAPCRVGSVRISPRDKLSSLDAARAVREAWSPEERFDRGVAEMKCDAFAEIEAETVDSALDVIEDAVDVLRVYQQARALGRCGVFGLPGDTQRTTFFYAQVGERTGFGGRFRGDVLGWTFTESSLADFSNSPAFRFVADTVGAATPSEGARRALLGVELLSQAILAHRPGLKLLWVVQALEAMLLRSDDHSRQRPKNLCLARYVAFFGCGSVEDDLCGRQRPTCPYLALDPTEKKNADELRKLSRRADSDPWWRCSEWTRVVEWYDLRNRAAHGEGRLVASKDASTAEYWVLHYLLEPILEWLSLHQKQPLDALELAVAALPDPPDWTSAFQAPHDTALS